MVATVLYSESVVSKTYIPFIKAKAFLEFILYPTFSDIRFLHQSMLAVLRLLGEFISPTKRREDMCMDKCRMVFLKVLKIQKIPRIL
ncbi:hypothetical protein CEXT_550711 [Caerostris extrusa]|uniref:Uncharacterized protein n=1 Tax=Caerostris extrusa TaxID=172846 RepID=A0AAV4XL78_CAEEX|nr:hypothetical protein CEXT_550711 [Caerostris extrusa]